MNSYQNILLQTKRSKSLSESVCRDLSFFTEKTTWSSRDMSRPQDKKGTLMTKRQLQSATFTSTMGGMLSKEKFANWNWQKCQGLIRSKLGKHLGWQNNYHIYIPLKRRINVSAGLFLVPFSSFKSTPWPTNIFQIVLRNCVMTMHKDK